MSKPCLSAHCRAHGFCNRCRPDLTIPSRFLKKAISSAKIAESQRSIAYVLLANVLFDYAPELESETANDGS